MSVHYKFKSALDFDTITFDGLHITVSDLKKAIIFQKRLGKTTDFDLKITNAQTKEDYDDDSYLIPKNTSLIIARIPLATLPKKVWEQQYKQDNQTKGYSKVDKVVLDLSKMIGSEEDKIQAMMQQSAADYDPKGYQKVKGQPQVGEVPANYRCNKCKKVGHWIKNCPYSGKDHIEMKRTTGIPKSFREKDDRSFEPNITESTTSRHDEKIPDNLICSICKDIFTDAVMIPCCGSSFCDDCVRTSLLESDDNECPDCKEKGSSPGSLIPNRFLRNSVNAFKNETGYKRPVKKQVAHPSEDSLLSQKILTNDSNQTTIIQDDNKTKSEDVMSSSEVNSATQSNESPSADESDFEDNITVTVPATASLENNTAVLQIKSNNEGNSSTIKNPEKTPRSLTQISAPSFDNFNAKFPHYLNSTWDAYNKKDEDEESQNKKRKLIKPLVQSSSTSAQSAMPKETQYPIARQEHYQQIPLHTFTPHQPLVHGHPIGYGQISTAHCNSYPHYAQLPYTSRMGCMPMKSSETPQLPLSVNLASVYEGVAAKVGSGVIDDPLEAFNRIMREKEKHKEHHRSPNRRSSRSKEKTFRKYSPQQLKRNRGPVSPYDTKPMPKINQRQSREREKIFYRNQGPELSRNYQKRSTSLSDRNTRAHQHGNNSHNFLKRDRYENEDLYKNNLLDICPPGTSERPPPGFENSSFKRDYRRNQKHNHDDYIKNRNYEKYTSPEFDNNKALNHSNGKESFHVDIGRKKHELSKSYSPYKSKERNSPYKSKERSSPYKLKERSSPYKSKERNSPYKSKERSEEFDLNPKDYTTYDEKETSQKDVKFYKDLGRKQSKKEIDMPFDVRVSPIQKINSLDIKKDTTNKHYNQHLQDYNKTKSETEGTTPRSDKINYDQEKKVKDKKKKKKSKDEKERKKQKKDGKSEKHIARRNLPEKNSCSKLLASDNLEGSTTKIKTKYEEHSSDLHRNVSISAINKEGRTQNNTISVKDTQESNKQSEEYMRDEIYSYRPLTGLSKWEREEENMFLPNYKESSEFESVNENLGKVNSEVLRRAENALFSRDIGNKIHSTHQKSHPTEKYSPRSKIKKRSRSRDHLDSNKSKDLVNVKLHQVKKVEKHNEENIGSFTKSVKSRLGIKVTKNDAELQTKRVNKFRSRSPSRSRSGSRSRGHHYNYDKEDNFEPDYSKRNSYIYKNKAKNPEVRDYKDDLQQKRYNESKNPGQQRSKRTFEISKEKREIDSNKEYSKIIHGDSKKEGTASKIMENIELNALGNKTKTKENKVNKINKEQVTSLKDSSSFEDKSNSSLASDNGLESDSAKRKKKRKNKKEKRRRKRSSSTESVQHSKKKHSKNKKKNKKKKKEL